MILILLLIRYYFRKILTYLKNSVINKEWYLFIITRRQISG